jgi:hypothetical protein
MQSRRSLLFLPLKGKRQGRSSSLKRKKRKCKVQRKNQAGGLFLTLLHVKDNNKYPRVAKMLSKGGRRVERIIYWLGNHKMWSCRGEECDGDALMYHANTIKRKNRMSMSTSIP